MIDLDLLDEQLEQALTDEVRTLRGPTLRRPAWHDRGEQQAAPPRAPSAAPDDGPDWDFDWSEPPEAATPEPAADPAPLAPAPPPVVVAPVVVAARPAAAAPRPAVAPPRPVEVRPGPERPPAATAPPPSRPRPSRPAAGPRPAPGSPLDRLRQAAAAMNGPDGAPRDLAIADEANRIPGLVARNELPLADQHIANHAALTAQRGTSDDRAQAAAWETMRALLDGRADDARDGVAAVQRLGERAGQAANADRTWTLRFWVGLEWGEDAEQAELLDHCRERAYRYDDLAWRGALTLQLARLGRMDEAAREFDVVAADLKRVSLDVLTDLAETAFLLRDGRRGAVLEQPLAAAKASLVTVGPAWVCKGSIVRFNAHLAAAKGDWNSADQWFAAALKVHRRLRTYPLVARTLHEWGTSLLGRNDDLARQYLDESAELGDHFRLAGLASVAVG